MKKSDRIAGGEKEVFEALEYFEGVFKDEDTIIFKELKRAKAYLVYSEGLANAEVINRDVIKPINELISQNENFKVFGDICNASSQKIINSRDEGVKAVLAGETLIILSGMPLISVDIKTVNMRAISEPENEKVLSGPRQGFNEALQVNVSMVKKIIANENLAVKTMDIGKLTATKVAVMYIKNLVPQEVLDNVFSKLKGIDIDSVLDSNYLAELISGRKFSMFRSTGATERPDVVAGKLLEGRVAIFVNGSPVVLTVPYLFVENFQSNEDYYLNHYYASVSRLLRILGFLITILVPGIYIAIVAFHQEVLPSPLLVNMAIVRESVPLPAVFELVILLAVFEILRETAVRMPSNIGQTFSIVGALVLGQAAVEAQLVAAPMIIVVAITGITGLLIPKLKTAVMLSRVFILLCTTLLGIIGMAIGSAVIIINIMSLDSFGVAQTMSAKRFNPQAIKDTFVRVPWYKMLTRPEALTSNRTRQVAKNTEPESNDEA